MSVDDELTRLVHTLHETQQRIAELTGGTVDAVVDSSGASYLLLQAQQQQRQAASQRAAILNALPAHIALLDATGRIITVNEAWRRFAVANVFPDHRAGIGQNYLEVCEHAHGDCSEEAAEAAVGIRAVLNGAQSFFSLEYPCHSPDERRWFRLMVTPVEEQGKGIGAVVTHVDVTARKLAEESLRASEQHYRILFENNPLPMWVYELDTLRFLAVNDVAVDRYGYTRDEFLAMTIADIRPQEDIPALLDSVAGVTEGIDHAGIWRHRLKNGRIIRVRIESHTLDFNGRKAELVLAIDMTEQLELEEQLRQSQRLESVGHLTGGIAHDFNNLLTVIVGNAELLHEELADDSRLQPLAEMIISGAQRGADLTQRLLAFARKQALDPRFVDVNRLVTGMEPMLHRTLGEQVEIELILDNGLWPVLIDPGQLEGALLNLAINARDALPRGGKLTIETTNTVLDEDYARQQIDVRPGEYVRVTVSDTGAGIPPEHLERVFEPFFTTKEKGKGTGLGLSMVYGFIKQSDGHVKLYSEPGHGTSIRMYLPRITGRSETLAATRTEHAATGGNETILLVEDDALVRSFAEGQLADLGYRVLAAANGPAALAILRQHIDIDLLFTDIVMPGGMNGRELAEAARQLRPHLRVLYTSGYSENAIVHHGRLDPGAQLLGKPYRRGELARKIREALDSV